MLKFSLYDQLQADYDNGEIDYINQGIYDTDPCYDILFPDDILTTTPVPEIMYNDDGTEMTPEQIQAEAAKKAAENFMGDATGNIDKMLRDAGIDWSTRYWINMFHQMMLFILIFGRWMLPRNRGTSRDELSQILLTFIGIAADMLEFVTETRKDLEIMCSDILLMLILTIWSWSTCQFFLVITSKGPQTTRQVPIFDSKHASPIMWVEEDIEMSACERFVKNPEVWSICSTLFMQDMPFLTMRLYVIFGKNVVKPMLVFFTLKNGVVFALEVYRLIVIATHSEDDDEDDDDKPEVKNRGLFS